MSMELAEEKRWCAVCLGRRRGGREGGHLGHGYGPAGVLDYREVSR